MTPTGARSITRAVYALAAIAVVLRLILAMISGPAPPESDGDHFDRIAQCLVEGRGFVETPGQRTAHRAPLQALWLALWYGLSGPSAWSGTIAAAVLGGVLVLVVAELGRELGGERARLMAAGIAVGFGHFLDYAVRLWSLSEGLFTVLVCGALASWCRAERGSKAGAWWAGVLLGLATLTRPISILMPGLFVVRGGSGRSPRVAVACLGFLLVLTPWTVRNWYTFGEFVPVSTMGGIVFYQGFHPPAGGWGTTPWDELRGITEGTANEVEASEVLVRRTLRDIRADPAAAARLLPWKLAGLWSPFSETAGTTDVAFVGVCLLGLFGVTKAWRRAECVVPLLAVAYISGMALVFYGSPRFRIGIEPVLVAFAGVGLASLLERRRGPLVVLLLILLLAGLDRLQLDGHSVRLQLLGRRQASLDLTRPAHLVHDHRRIQVLEIVR